MTERERDSYRARSVEEENDRTAITIAHARAKGVAACHSKLEITSRRNLDEAGDESVLWTCHIFMLQPQSLRSAPDQFAMYSGMSTQSQKTPRCLVDRRRAIRSSGELRSEHADVVAYPFFLVLSDTLCDPGDIADFLHRPC